MARATLVFTGAPLSRRASDLVSAFRGERFEVDYIVTEAAEPWISGTALQRLNVQGRASRPGSPVPRLPLPDVVVVCPATFNTLNKVAAGIADTHAHSFLCECLGAGLPMIWVPLVNDRLWRHPACAPSLQTIRTQPACHVLDPRTLDTDLQPVESGNGDAVIEQFDPVKLARLAQLSVG